PDVPTPSAPPPSVGLLSVPWQTAFNNLAANHGQVLEAAVDDTMGAASYQSSLVTSATEADGPVYALAAIVRDSKAKSDSYAANGRLRPGDKDPLYLGLLIRKLDEAFTNVDSAKSILLSARDTFNTSWISLINAQQQVVSSGTQVQK